MLTRGNERPIAVTAINVGFRNRIATCGMRRCAPEPSPWFSQIWELLEERLVVLERIRWCLGLDLHLVPQALIAEHVDVVFPPIDLGFHVEKQREEARREPEVVAADLPLVLALVQGRVGERLTVGIDELILSELFLEAGLRGK